MKKIFLTGGAGFVAYHLAEQIAQYDDTTLYIMDNLNSYYDVRLKLKRLDKLGFREGDIMDHAWVTSQKYPQVHFLKADLADSGIFKQYVSDLHCDYIIHLAAQAGVRYSFENPDAYVSSNLIGFYNILELAKFWSVRHFIFASSSSVYGGIQVTPFLESQSILKPLNLYAATKGSNELMGYAYANLYQVPTSALRFFTVYGPYGRPDMAYFKFLDHLYSGTPIEVYGRGDLYRDFTHVSDIVASMLKLLDVYPDADDHYAVYNIGNNKPIQLLYFIQLLEKYTGRKAILNLTDAYNGEMKITYANIDKLIAKIHYAPKIEIEEGLLNFVEWYNSNDNPLHIKS